MVLVVERHDDQPHPEAGEVADDRLAAVGQQQGHPIPFLEPQRREGCSRAPRPCNQHADAGVRGRVGHGRAAGHHAGHAIAFAEASTLFTSGVEYLEIFDVEHAVEEERFICIGPIARGIVVVVTVDVDIDVIRIISARLASRRESLLYADFLEERSDGR